MLVAEKPNRIRDLGPIDCQPICDRLDRLSDKAWARADMTKENKFFCFQNTQHVIHRFTPQNKDVWDHYETQAWMIWRDLLEPLMDQITNQYGYKKRGYPKSMFARLAAGKLIDQHKDGAGSNLQSHKIHVPLVTNPKVSFHIDDEDFYLEKGRAYEVNNIVSHGVSNNSSKDRIHFIFEVFDASYNP